jgi:cephalosporin hydroxylase
MNFNEFKLQKYNCPPYDFENNPKGFPNRRGGNDISAHLPLLEYFASQCSTVTEFGVREGYSTTAFLSGSKNLVISYDIHNSAIVPKLENMDLPCKWKFIWEDTTKVKDIDSTDFLFLDTLHTYEQVKSELRFHTKVNRFIGFHDTWSHGEKSLDVPGKIGIMPAIKEFLDEHREWKIIYKVDFNHGLIILEKQQKEE